LREEHRLRVFENKVLRKIFGVKRDEVTGEWRKLDNTELHALYSSPDIIRNIKSRRLRWAGHVACMGESRNAYRVLVGRPEGKIPLGRPRHIWEDNIKMDLREVGYDDREWINLAQDRDRWRAYVRAAMNSGFLKSQASRRPACPNALDDSEGHVTWEDADAFDSSDMRDGLESSDEDSGDMGYVVDCHMPIVMNDMSCCTVAQLTPPQDDQAAPISDASPSLVKLLDRIEHSFL
ncbi:hypothetical protein ANN_09636, partial [Periplaneta americana]